MCLKYKLWSKDTLHPVAGWLMLHVLIRSTAHIQTLIYFKLNWIVIWLISVHALEKEVMAVPFSILQSSPIWGYSPFLSQVPLAMPKIVKTQLDITVGDFHAKFCLVHVHFQYEKVLKY